MRIIWMIFMMVACCFAEVNYQKLQKQNNAFQLISADAVLIMNKYFEKQQQLQFNINIKVNVQKKVDIRHGPQVNNNINNFCDYLQSKKGTELLFLKDLSQWNSKDKHKKYKAIAKFYLDVDKKYLGYLLYEIDTLFEIDQILLYIVSKKQLVAKKEIALYENCSSYRQRNWSYIVDVNNDGNLDIISYKELTDYEFPVFGSASIDRYETLVFLLKHGKYVLDVYLVYESVRKCLDDW